MDYPSLSILQDGIEECRKLCGGHGYLCSSGLPELFAVYVPACTYEGDNVVLLLQVSELPSIMIFFFIDEELAANYMSFDRHNFVDK